MNDLSYCSWLHNTLLALPLISYPFELKDLPKDGIYFFYQDGELVKHGDIVNPRIVRVGTHKNGNFRSRIDQHFLVKKESKDMSFKITDRAPKDRSIFRKHLGRCFLSQSNPEYLKIWNTDFTKKKNRNDKSLLQNRNIDLEHETENKITFILRNDFSFRFIIIDDEDLRMGDEGFEKKLVGTLSHCEFCKPSSNWLGSNHPDSKVSSSGLWQVHYLNSKSINSADQEVITSMVDDTLNRINR